MMVDISSGDNESSFLAFVIEFPFFSPRLPGGLISVNEGDDKKCSDVI